MEYSIHELSHLSGVTTRTLRWYDEIGLLKPSRVAESGYRYYSGTEVDRLQDILYYRALGVELARIKRCLDDPSFDRLAALRSHLTALEAERARLEGLIRSVRQTIGAEERKEIMDDKQKFEDKKELFKEAAAYLNKKYGSGSIEVQVKDSYYNMKEKIEPYMYLIDEAKAAMEELGITPVIVPIRGGTDGARLSYMGLPCPNLCTGGHNFHGKYEYICAESMETITELLIRIAKRFGEMDR